LRCPVSAGDGTFSAESMMDGEEAEKGDVRRATRGLRSITAAVRAAVVAVAVSSRPLLQERRWRGDAETTTTEAEGGASAAERRCLWSQVRCCRHVKKMLWSGAAARRDERDADRPLRWSERKRPSALALAWQRRAADAVVAAAVRC
jgi:hypothetical protein